jgi:hypothetical protein
MKRVGLDEIDKLGKMAIHCVDELHAWAERRFVLVACNAEMICYADGEPE